MKVVFLFIPATFWTSDFRLLSALSLLSDSVFDSLFFYKVFPSVFVQQGAAGALGDAGTPGKPGAKGLQGPTVGTHTARPEHRSRSVTDSQTGSVLLDKSSSHVENSLRVTQRLLTREEARNVCPAAEGSHKHNQEATKSSFMLI